MSNPDPSGREPVDRRKFLAIGAGAFVVAALPRVLSGKGRQRLTTRMIPVMGTIAEIKVVHSNQAVAEAGITAAMDELRRVDRTMTRFSRHSEIGVANLMAARRPVPIGPDTARVVERALFWAERTGGRFDPCLGEATELWDVDHRKVPPPEQEVTPFAGRQLYRELEVGRYGGQTVLVYHDKDLAIDLGAIGKGYALDLAVEALRRHGIKDAVVNCGGEVYAMGHSERGDAWEIGVQSPTDPNGIIARFPLTDRAVSTSGDYRQFFDYKGRRYSHLLDPRTGAPRVTHEHSITVEAANGMDADAASTAVFGVPTATSNDYLGAVMPGMKVIHHA
jgi:thiamine biosynthesis lipoprotein